MHDPENYDKLKMGSGTKNIAAEILLVPLLNKLKIKTGHNQNILDFGCGSGLTAITYLLPLAENTNSNIVGIDISEEMINYAIKTYSNNKRIKFLCGNIMSKNFNFDESYFDQIISFYVLHFIKDYKEAFKRLYGILKPGGQCGFIIVIEHDQLHSYKILGEDPKWSKYMKGYEEFYPDWMETENPNETGKIRIGNAAKEVGFNITELNLKDMSGSCDSLNIYTEFVLTLNALVNQIPKEMSEELHSSFRSHICKRYNIPDTEEYHKKPYHNNNYQVLSVILEKPSFFFLD